MSRLRRNDPFLRARPVYRKADYAHYQIRRVYAPGTAGHGCYLVWPDGPTTETTVPIAAVYDHERALELAKRGGQ